MVKVGRRVEKFTAGDLVLGRSEFRCDLVSQMGELDSVI